MYLKSVLFLLFFIYSNIFGWHFRIGIGKPAQRYPFIVGILIDESEFCGGTIIKSNFILTARHCVCDNTTLKQKLSAISVRYGSNDWENGKKISVANVTCNRDHDVAILQLKENLPSSNKWKAAKLAKIFDTSVNHSATAIGWGAEKQDSSVVNHLRELNVTVYQSKFCKDYEPATLCFGAKEGGICKGDSGSAVFQNDDTLVGVISFLTNKCGTSNTETPNGAINVAYVYNWIAGIAHL